jgi:hypothetical protein
MVACGLLISSPPPRVRCCVLDRYDFNLVTKPGAVVCVSRLRSRLRALLGRVMHSLSRSLIYSFLLA